LIVGGGVAGNPDDPFCFAENLKNLYLILTNLVGLDTPCCPEFQVIISRKFVNTLAPSVGTTWLRVPVNTRILGIFYGKYAVNSKKYG
jgi:hypothetical protein